MKVAFLGLGNMGLPMASNLAKAGYSVTGFDPSPNAVAAARQAGVVTAENAVAAVGGAETVFTMLPAGRHVLGVMDEVLAHSQAGTLYVDCSTIDVASARAVHDRAGAYGMTTVDAPVSGVGGAVGGTLTFMAGGHADAFARARPLLERMGRRIVHCGDAGAGQAAKICNNMILGISMIAVGEAFVLGEKLGLSHQALFDVASTSSGQCWSLTTYCPVPGPVASSPANADYKPGFAAALMLKDLRLARDAAETAGADTALGKHAVEIYEIFERDGHAGLDFSAIIEAIRGRSGRALPGDETDV